MSESDTDRILSFMDEINAVPRQSHHLEKIHPWLMDWGRAHGFDVKTDSSRNILIRVPPTMGYEQAPIVVLQGHMDMVCEKRAGVEHDFQKDPILSWQSGDWLKARDTSLGADNAIALAMFFALITEPEAQHPELEILITADEETGLIGAQNIEDGFLQGRVLLNLDSEEEGVFTIGCSGGMDFNLNLPIDREPVPLGFIAMEIRVEGLAGGHSGIDIHLGRANANMLLSRLLAVILESIPEAYLGEISGGTAHNAIPRDSMALIAIPDVREADLRQTMRAFKVTLLREYANMEPELTLSAVRTDATERTMMNSRKGTRLIDTLRLIPHGVHSLSTEIDGEVDTSLNFASLNSEESQVRVLTNIRSTLMSRGIEMSAILKGLACLYGGSYKGGNPYPSWEPDYDSMLLERAKRIWKEINGEQAKVEVTHAGLECGAIGAHFPGMEMISFGPTIEQPHSPDERLFIPSVGRVYTFLKKLIRSFKHSP